MLQLFDFFSGDSDEQRKQRARMATERRAREGYGGGSGEKDAAYDPNTGLTNLGNKKKGYTPQIIAPRNGVMGAMVPGKPETWAALKSNKPSMQGAARRYEQLGGDMSGINARRFPYTGMADMSGDPIRPVVTPPVPETVVEAPGGGAGGGSGAAGAPGRSSGSAGVGPSNTETRTNPNRVTQTGRNLSKINLTPSAGVADFTGPSFPTQAASNQISAPYPNTTPDGLEKTKENFFGPYERVLTQGYKQNPGHLEGEPAEVPGTSVQLPRTATSSYETFGPNDPRFADAFGEDLAKSLGGTSRYGDSGAERPQNPARRRRSGDIRDRDIDARGGFDPRSDRRGGSDDDLTFKPTDGAISGQEARRRAAFLSSPGGSLGGIQAVDDELGRKRMDGKTYFAVNGQYQEVDPAQFRELGQIDQSEVDSWRADWMKTNIQNKPAESGSTGKANYNQPVPVPAQAQNPTVIPPEKPESFNVPGRKFGPGGLFQ